MSTDRNRKKRVLSHESALDLSYYELATKCSKLSIDEGEGIDPDIKLNLGTLPSLVIREIIKTDFKSIATLRLINRRWNVHAADILNNKICRTGVKLLIWKKDFFKQTTLIIRVPLSHLSFLGVDGWPFRKKLPGFNPENLIDVGIRIPNEKNDQLLERIKQLLSRCSCIEKVEIDMQNFGQDGEEIEVIRGAMK
ncbi:hypothetical protein PMAYCL1PPCAC_05903, partial [Pristionchus mayeri]